MKRKNEAIRFLGWSAFASLIILLATVGINIYIDLYGLFRSVEGRQIVVHNNERISKYLLSRRYIPQNFNALIVGPSLSDNLNVTLFNEKSTHLKIYNGSIMGANISELKPIVENAILGKVTKVVFCLNPYLFGESENKEVKFDDRLYYGAVGSIDLYQTYLVAVIRHFNMLPNKFPKNQIDYSGVNNYEFSFKQADIRAKIDEELKLHKDEDLKMDSIALDQFKDLVTVLKNAGVEVYGYFHPLPYEIYENNRKKYEDFKHHMKSILKDDTKLVDFNELEYYELTHDYDHFIDHGHLSVKGQQRVLGVILPLISK
jgi:hypothetical protein